MPDHSSKATTPKPHRMLAAIRVSGADRYTLLQGQLTQDMSQLAPDKPLLAGWTNPKGRLICLCWLFDWHNTLWLVVPDELRDRITKRLKMFVLRADAQVENSSLLVHPANKETLNSLFSSKDLLELKDTYDCFYSDSIFFLKQAGLAIGSSVTAGNTTSWRLANIRAGIPSLWTETCELFIPQMLNLDLLGAISFSKGCYVGQEIIARTQNLGRIKRRMYGFKVPSGRHIQPGDPVYIENGTTVGTVVDAIPSDTVTELLAVIRIELLAHSLSLAKDGSSVLKPVSLPYTIPETV